MLQWRVPFRTAVINAKCCALQRNDNGERIYGDAEVFATLAQLTRLHLEHTAFTGTLMTGPRVESVLTIGSKHDSFKPGSAPGDDFGLKRIVMMNGHMTGPVPINILSAPALTYLSLKGNQFSSVPQDWGVTALRLLDLSDNALEVRIASLEHKIAPDMFITKSLLAVVTS